MKNKFTILQNGIWERPVLTPTYSAEDLNRIHKIPVRSDKEYVHVFLDAWLSRATKILEQKGHPTRGGIYKRCQDGSFEWIGDSRTNATKLIPTEEQLLWPDFLKIDPLTIEEMSIVVILRTRAV